MKTKIMPNALFTCILVKYITCVSLNDKNYNKVCSRKHSRVYSFHSNDFCSSFQGICHSFLLGMCGRSILSYFRYLRGWFSHL